MELQCDICFVPFDVDHHRPKSLPCGHTLCKECVKNPALGRKCPTCRKDLAADDGADLPDNILVIQIIAEGPNPLKRTVREKTKMQQLQQGVSVGKKMVQQLRQMVPTAVDALNRQLDTSVAVLQQMEEALEREREQAADNVGHAPDVAVEQQVEQMEDSLLLLASSKCSFVAEERGVSWSASVQHNDGGLDDIVRLLLLQLRVDGRLRKDDVTHLVHAPYVGPPGMSILHINAKEDLDGDNLKVNEILQKGKRWKNIRSLKKLKGDNSESLLRVVGPHLEDLEVVNDVGPSVFAEIKDMKSLKRLVVTCNPDLSDYPDLPLQLEELSITFPSENQLRCVQRMPALRSLLVDEYHGPNVVFPPAQSGGLLWLSLGLNVEHKATMLSLIRAHASSLQQLHIFSRCYSHPPTIDDEYYFSDLGQDLAGCRLQALRRLVIERSGASSGTCKLVDACLLQLRSIQGYLHSVEVLCNACHRAVLI